MEFIRETVFVLGVLAVLGYGELVPRRPAVQDPQRQAEKPSQLENIRQGIAPAPWQGDAELGQQDSKAPSYAVRWERGERQAAGRWGRNLVMTARFSAESERRTWRAATWRRFPPSDQD